MDDGVEIGVESLCINLPRQAAFTRETTEVKGDSYMFLSIQKRGANHMTEDS